MLHKFDRDLYGQQLKVCICGYLRPEKNFDSLDALIEAIKNDIDETDKRLDESAYAELKNNDFFKSENNNMNES